MIAWSTVAPALRSLLSDLALAAPVTPDFEAQWSEKASEYRHPEVQKALLLRVTRVAGDETYRQYVATTVDDETILVEHLVGQREFTIEVRVESHEHDEAGTYGWAWSMLERVRTSLMFQRAIDALLAVDVGIVRLSDSRDVSFTFDKRRINAALFEATFNAAFDLSDAVPANWFEHAALTSRFQDAAGVTLSSPPNITDVVVPPLEEEPPPEEP